MRSISANDIAALRKAERVVIFGSSGAGKSTFSARLAPLLDLPLVHLDKLYWLPGWQPRSEQEWISMMELEVKKDRWLMDGNYGNTLDLRLRRADCLLWFDLPRWLCLCRVLKRVLTGYGEVRPDLAPGCPEKWDGEFMRYVWNFNKQTMPPILEKIADAPTTMSVIRLRRPADIKALLVAISRV